MVVSSPSSFPLCRVLLFSSYVPVPVPPPLLTFFAILSFLILSSFVTLHIHRSIRIYATSNLFACAFFNVSAPYMYQCQFYHCPVQLPLGSSRPFSVAQHSTPVFPMALHYVGDFCVQFSILWQSRIQIFEFVHSLYCFFLQMDMPQKSLAASNRSCNIPLRPVSTHSMGCMQVCSMQPMLWFFDDIHPPTITKLEDGTRQTEYQIHM